MATTFGEKNKMKQQKQETNKKKKQSNTQPILENTLLAFGVLTLSSDYTICLLKNGFNSFEAI